MPSPIVRNQYAVGESRRTRSLLTPSASCLEASRPPPNPFRGCPFVLVSFLPKNHLFLPSFQHLFPVFCHFLQNEPNSLFHPTYSFLNTSVFFSWVRLVETLFYIREAPAKVVVAACSRVVYGAVPAALQLRHEAQAVSLRSPISNSLCLRTPSVLCQTTITPIPPPPHPVQQKYRFPMAPPCWGVLAAFTPNSFRGSAS